MENIKAYIESGVLELYVLGDLSPEEVAQVEEIASRYPEVKQEIDAIEKAMEAYAVKNSVEPSAEVEIKLFEKLGLNKKDNSTEYFNTNFTGSEPKILKLDTNNRKIRTLKFALVACVALLVMSTVALFTVYNQLNDANSQITSLNFDKQKFAGVVSHLEFENKGLDNIVAMADSKEWATIKMQGQAYSPKSKMKVYWNKNDKSVLINYVAMDLPKTDTEHEYQLWALVNGKPVSLGVFGNQDSTGNEAMRKMETVQIAQAFAVTIEPKGGSVNPTMEKLTVMGGV